MPLSYLPFLLYCKSRTSFFFFYFFIYFWLHWVFAAARGLFLVAALRCSARASHCSGLSRRGAQAPGTRASVVVTRGLSSCGLRALEHRPNSCGSRAQLLCGMRDLVPNQGSNPCPLQWKCGVLTTGPPRKSQMSTLLTALALDCFMAEFYQSINRSF